MLRYLQDCFPLARGRVHRDAIDSKTRGGQLLLHPLGQPMVVVRVEPYQPVNLAIPMKDLPPAPLTGIKEVSVFEPRGRPQPARRRLPCVQLPCPVTLSDHVTAVGRERDMINTFPAWRTLQPPDLLPARRVPERGLIVI